VESDLFLAQFYRVWKHNEKYKTVPILIGQDKVDRMARLCLLNLYLFGISDAKITRGNSISGKSPLDEYIGKCDLILTNPPFGARFNYSDIFSNINNYENFKNILRSRNSLIDSELLFIDRYINLLKPGGTFLAVLPDSVISSKGMPALLRDELQQKYTIKSITELPAVTFAQAGTRTKTCILEIEKSKPSGKFIFMNVAKSLGFEVSTKKGVPYKKKQGENDLTPLSKCLLSNKNNNLEDLQIIETIPSCVVISHNRLTKEGWTPSHYSAERISTVNKINGFMENEYDVMTLESIVTIPFKNLKEYVDSNNQKCISVLHVGDFGALNVRELMDYTPKTPGKHCQKGDLLFSKINPRIPRVIIVPDIPYDLSCSSEFEVLRPKEGYNSYEIMLLLLSDYAQNQIRSLTSGTSSSHNRIKTKELLSIKLPIPKRESKLREKYDSSIEEFKKSYIQLNKSNIMLYDNWKCINSLFAS